jgi:phage/conjugal plasmid C-4 type zinc finger TraR family protein
MTDWIDRAQEVEQRARDVSLRSVQRVAAALGQPRTSPLCEDCPDPIEPERLAACPGATRCIVCQERHERFVRTHAR